MAQGEISERLVRHVKDRPGHDRRSAIDCTKIERECAFMPRISLEAGLRRTVSCYLDRADTLPLGMATDHCLNAQDSAYASI